MHVDPLRSTQHFDISTIGADQGTHGDQILVTNGANPVHGERQKSLGATRCGDELNLNMA